MNKILLKISPKEKRHSIQLVEDGASLKLVANELNKFIKKVNLRINLVLNALISKFRTMFNSI